MYAPSDQPVLNYCFCLRRLRTLWLKASGRGSNLLRWKSQTQRDLRTWKKFIDNSGLRFYTKYYQCHDCLVGDLHCIGLTTLVLFVCLFSPSCTFLVSGVSWLWPDAQFIFPTQTDRRADRTSWTGLPEIRNSLPFMQVYIKPTLWNAALCKNFFGNIFMFGSRNSFGWNLFDKADILILK